VKQKSLLYAIQQNLLKREPIPRRVIVDEKGQGVRRTPSEQEEKTAEEFATSLVAL